MIGGYALLFVIPLLQVFAIVVIVKKLHGTKSLVFGVLALGCWLLSGLVAMFFYEMTSADRATTMAIVAFLNLIGWLSFLGMLMTLPVRGHAPIAASPEPDGIGAPVTDSPSVQEKTDGRPDLIYRYGKIGVPVAAAVYLIAGGYKAILSGDILTAVLWAFIVGALGGGLGAAAGMLLQKYRS